MQKKPTMPEIGGNGNSRLDLQSWVNGDVFQGCA